MRKIVGRREAPQGHAAVTRLAPVLAVSLMAEDEPRWRYFASDDTVGVTWMAAPTARLCASSTAPSRPRRVVVAGHALRLAREQDVVGRTALRRQIVTEGALEPLVVDMSRVVEIDADVLLRVDHARDSKSAEPKSRGGERDGRSTTKHRQRQDGRAPHIHTPRSSSARKRNC